LELLQKNSAAGKNDPPSLNRVNWLFVVSVIASCFQGLITYKQLKMKVDTNEAYTKGNNGVQVTFNKHSVLHRLLKVCLL